MVSSSSLDSNEAELNKLKEGMSVEAMQEVFARSDEAHTLSMDALMKTMTVEEAHAVLQKSNMSSPALMEVIDMVNGTHGKLRKQPKGYAGVDGAKKMLNDMLYEAMLKYDEDISKCTEYYATTCGQMEVLRGRIAAANYMAANSRSLILDSQATINKAEVDIPTTKLELKVHNKKCKTELGKMNSRLQVILGDIAVMTTILEMTDCEANAKKTFFTQTNQSVGLLRCWDTCSKQSFISFNDNALKEKVAQLQSSSSNKLLKDTFNDMFEGIQGLQESEVQLMQINAHDTLDISPVVNKTNFSNPPVPRTEVPGNPCNDPLGGAPMKGKRKSKCALTGADCFKLQERFLLIQSGIKDDRDNLKEDIEELSESCSQQADKLMSSIADSEDRLDNAQTKLAEAMSKEATAGEVARQTNDQHEKLDGELRTTMKKCSAGYASSENEMCALKKIRGELTKMKGSNAKLFFQDCIVSKWEPEQCSKECMRDGTAGEQRLTREVMTAPEGGAKCLPLEAVKSCGQIACPVDCELEPWGGWSKCSAKCGGGVQQRVREVKVAMANGGKPCGQTSQSRGCAGQACEKDCELGDWTGWSACSKDCDGGTRKRQKYMTAPAEGAGTCPDQWAPARLQYKPCNMFRCYVPPTAKIETQTCDAPIDVVLLIDGSGSLGTAGWKAEIHAAETFVNAFASGSSQAQIAVILYSGPITWSGVRKCFMTNQGCKIDTVAPFSSDFKGISDKISALTWPKGSTLTSLALAKAKTMLSLGRPDSKSVVVAITDGRPLSYRGTGIMSKIVRKSARLVWVPVTRYAPLSYIKTWATRRWQENVVVVKSFEDLQNANSVVDHIIANICPKTLG
jgi:hypothetical protein